MPWAQEARRDGGSEGRRCMKRSGVCFFSFNKPAESENGFFGHFNVKVTFFLDIFTIKDIQKGLNVKRSTNI